ncbi:MAG: hypothetical protein K2X11_15795, partial [Acetobacteraceae bacterium]|nr:hypothetical protein [Acetobacteraceae bacterium]
VAAVVRGGAHPGAAALALARRPGTSDWAAAVTLLPRDAYRFEVEVRRPGLPPVSAGFVHRQLQP